MATTQATKEELDALIKRDQEEAKERVTDPDADIDDKVDKNEKRQEPLQFTIENVRRAEEDPNVWPKVAQPVTPEQQAQARAMQQREAIEQALQATREQGQQEGIITGIVMTLVVAGLAYGGLWAYQAITSKEGKT